MAAFRSPAPAQPEPQRHVDCLSGGGEMGALLRSIDWRQTPLGPVAGWPPSLQTVVGVVLGSRFPMLLWWGPDLLQIYNDAYRPILGSKHPASLLARGAEVWAEVWDVLGPMARSVLRGGPATWSEHLLLLMDRGFLQETYFTFSYSPVPGEGGHVAGVLVTVQETTQQVQDNRQLLMLRDLAASAAEARSAEDACRAAAAIFAANDADLPFTLLYLLDEDGLQARLVSRSGLDGYAGPAAPALISMQAPHPFPLAEAWRAGRELVVDDLHARFGALPGGRWGAAPRRAIVLPLSKRGLSHPYGFLLCGMSPRRAYDDRYLALFRLSADQVTSAIANARAYEDAARRAEELARLDRLKTAFFSNVSHELRTPLTLILAPLEDALAAEDAEERALTREALLPVHRNALRLLKMVNALLDFARIEAGRASACYEPTDLAALTADVASAFRAAIERAGLAFVVDCPPLPAPLYIDHEMWEKIVLNLLSNALKFTFVGAIHVSLRWLGDRAQLAVSDTGTGIPAAEQAHVFERFHRVQGARARTYEGSGIGLALVRELARLHGGTAEVESELGVGTTFRVTIPQGTAHLPQDRLCARTAASGTAMGAAPYLEEALRWLDDGPAAPVLAAGAVPEAGARPGAAQRTDEAGAHILLADDNADMRDYLGRLLSRRFSVEAVGDGAAALAAARRRRPDLVLTDVMMPNLDGLGLLRALRAAEETRALPVIMLSARADEGSRVEGLEAGADDYLIKPFSGRELLARVNTHLQLARLRTAAEQANRAKDEFLAMLGHELRNPLAPIVTALHLMRLRAGGVAEKERVIIERQVSHLTRLVEDLLDVSRITRGKIELHRQRLEVSECVAQAIEMASPLLEQRRSHLQVNVPPRGLPVLADPTRLAQVLSNLLTNAAKYTERGGNISISASRQDGERGGEIEIRVRDDGIGITPEMLPRIFDTFVQERQSLDRSQGGLGLGLAIVRNLVHLHGGSVSAQSAGKGQGSEFVVRLPAAPQDA